MYAIVSVYASRRFSSAAAAGHALGHSRGEKTKGEKEVERERIELEGMLEEIEKDK